MNASFAVKEEILMCPICMDDILSITNNVKTECGHEFHTNCLMQNVAHNGFGCPCCRAKMAEEVDDEDDEDDEFEDEDLYNTETYTLNTMRWMFQRENGEEVDDEDDYDEDDYDSESDEHMTNRISSGMIYPTHTDSIGEERFPTTGTIVIPEPEYMIQKLKEKGITYNDLVLSWLAGITWTEWSEMTHIVDIRKKICDTTYNIMDDYLNLTPEVESIIKPEEKLGHFLSNRFYNVV